MSPNDYDEKRAYHRMKIDTPITFSLSGDKEITHRGISKNLSASGLLIQSDFSPAEHDRLEIVMDTGNDRFSPFIIQGKVLRVEADTEMVGQYLISILIEESQ
ncbi:MULTISPECIES: PilZ domain-containing protein [unclassified Methylophaga]|uniref:PilZ domain-containing protein n=1 Tax=unclassified Methylophaga TaxID=2629249 RepID=UPI000C4C96CA|nr:PilZ domain-containing protein [Methylophaga sp. UBA678]MAX52820.1 hypothetical protein [Methylophaga sp.]|tara:strand:- start:3286 stop:3594 length:309 start_codon:yes stop_codon:yes gene_type:complete